MDFLSGLSEQIVGAAQRGPNQFDLKGLLFTLAVGQGAKSKDEMGALQATQMAEVHQLVMKYVAEVERAEILPHKEHAVRALNQLARTFTSQFEAYNRYRAGAEQNVMVQNLSVSGGGQAIVGNVNNAAGDAASSARQAQPVPALTDAGQAPMGNLAAPELVFVPIGKKDR